MRVIEQILLPHISTCREVFILSYILYCTHLLDSMQLSHYSFCPFIKTKYLTCFREKSIDLHGNEMLKVREGKNKVWVQGMFCGIVETSSSLF